MIKTLNLFLLLLLIPITASSQINMEPSSGPYGVEIQTLDVIGESILINSGRAVYYKESDVTDWIKIDYPNPLAFPFYDQTFKGEDEQYYLRHDKSYYRLNFTTLEWDHIITIDFYASDLKIASDGSAMCIKDFKHLMYAASDLQFVELMDIEAYLEDAYQIYEWYDVNALLVSNDLFMLHFGEDKNHQYVLAYYQGGVKIEEKGNVFGEKNDPIMDPEGNLYFKASGITKYTRQSGDEDKLKYNGSQFSAVREYAINRDGRLFVSNNRDYLYSDDGGATWETFSPYGFISSHQKHRFFVGHENEVILCGSRGFNTSSIERYDMVNAARLEIETHFAEPSTSEFRIYDDKIIANDMSDDAFISYDGGTTWSIIPVSSEMDDANVSFVNGMFYSADYNGVFRSSDLITWEKIDNFTTHSYAVGYNNEIVFRANDNVMIYNTDTGQRVQRSSKGIIHPDGNLYYRNGDDLIRYDPNSDNTTAVSNIGFIGSASMNIDKDGHIVFIENILDQTDIWVSDDHGLTFEKRSSLMDFEPYRIAIADAHYIMAEEGRLMISSDNGYSWVEQLYDGVDYDPSTLALDKDYYLFFGMARDVVYKSKDPLDLDQEIQGTVYHDQNMDCEDNDALTLRNQKLVFTDTNGQEIHTVVGNSPFGLTLPVVDYSIVHEVDNNLWSSCQNPYTFDANNPTSLSIGAQASEDCSQYDVHVNNLFLRRCFDNTLFVKICNTGSIPSSSDETIDITLDPFMDFLSASQPPIVINGSTLTMDIADLDPFDCRSIYIDFNLNCNAALGALHCVQTVIQNSTPCSTDDALQVKVRCAQNVGSYDPNDMHAIVKTEMVQEKNIDLSTSEMEYIVRFQNTGTDTAFTVRLETQLDSPFDKSSVQVIDYSHPYMFVVDDNGILTVTFNDIQLPYEDIDEEGSHGHFTFKVDLSDDLSEGDRIESQCDIYFDFNDAIVTNEVVLEAKTTSIVSDPELEETTIYPNPIEEVLHLTFNNDVSGTILVVDMYGRLIADRPINNQSYLIMQTEDWYEGIYVISIKTEGEMIVKKVIKN